MKSVYFVLVSVTKHPWTVIENGQPGGESDERPPPLHLCWQEHLGWSRCGTIIPLPTSISGPGLGWILTTCHTLSVKCGASPCSRAVCAQSAHVTRAMSYSLDGAALTSHMKHWFLICLLITSPARPKLNEAELRYLGTVPESSCGRREEASPPSQLSRELLSENNKEFGSQGLLSHPPWKPVPLKNI